MAINAKALNKPLNRSSALYRDRDPKDPRRHHLADCRLALHRFHKTHDSRIRPSCTAGLGGSPKMVGAVRLQDRTWSRCVFTGWTYRYTDRPYDSELSIGESRFDESGG